MGLNKYIFLFHINDNIIITLDMKPDHSFLFSGSLLTHIQAYDSEFDKNDSAKCGFIWQHQDL